MLIGAEIALALTSIKIGNRIPDAIGKTSAISKIPCELEAVAVPADAHAIGRHEAPGRVAGEFLVAHHAGAAGGADDVEIHDRGAARGEVGFPREDGADPTVKTALGVHRRAKLLEGVMLGGGGVDDAGEHVPLELWVHRGGIGESLNRGVGIVGVGHK